MRRGTLALLAPLLLAAAWPARALDFEKDIKDPHELIEEASEAEIAKAKPLARFPEQLVYEVGWGILTVGEATLSVEKIVKLDGRPAYEIVSRAVSNGFCDTFYKVRDLNKSWIDAATLDSLGYLKQLREGKFFRDEWVLFDPKSQRFLARTTNKDGQFSVKTGTTPARVQDILSAMYFIRSHDLTEGAEIILDVNTKENWPLVVKVIKRETIKVPAGKFKTVLVEPFIRKEGIFIQKGKRLRIWLTDDARKLPVKMAVEVFFGDVTTELTKAI